MVIKFSLSMDTPLAPREMKLIHRGKVLGNDDRVPPGATLMLMRQPAPRDEPTTITVDFHEIVTGISATHVAAPAAASHDDLVQLALSSLHMCLDDGEACCLRFYLPHVGSLMRADLCPADYAIGLPAGRRLCLYLIPAPPELAPDALTKPMSAEAEEAAQRRLRLQAEAEAEAVRLAVRQMMTLPLEDEAAEAAEAAETAGSADLESAATSKGGKAAPTAEEAARAACEAALVPSRIRTGLVADPDDVHVVAPAPSELLAELEAFEAYDAELREVSSLPYAEARAMLVAAEEARLEERCAQLLWQTAAEEADAAAMAAGVVEPSSPRLGSPLRPPTPRTQPAAAKWGEARPSGATGLFRTPSSRRSRAERVGLAPLPMADLSASLSASSDASEPTSLELSAVSSAAFALPDSICHVIDDDLSEGSTPLLLADALPAAATAAATATAAARKPKRPRCKTCDCTLPLTATCSSTCGCGDIFCARHMHAHDCIVDYHAREQRKLQEDNPKMQPSKVERWE